MKRGRKILPHLGYSYCTNTFFISVIGVSIFEMPVQEMNREETPTVEDHYGKDFQVKYG